MNRKLYWGLGVLIILLCAFVFITVRDRAEIRQLEKELVEAKKLEKEMKQQPVVKVDRKPPPGASPAGHWHGDEWHDASHQTLIDAKPKTEPVQVKSVVINGVGDLMEYLTFFESFGDDPTLETLHAREYNENRIRLGLSLRDFDYENSSPEMLELVDKVLEKSTALGYIYADKFNVEWQKLRTEPEVPEDFRTTIAMPDANEGGNE